MLAFVNSSPTRHGLDPVTASSTAVSSDKSAAALALASSSRSQRAMRTARAAACLTWEALSVGVRWRPLLSVVIVTHLVTRSLVSRWRERLLRSSSRADLQPVTLQLSEQTMCL